MTSRKTININHSHEIKSVSNKKLNSPPLNKSTTGINSKNNRNIK
jgi:hypothetical protein